MGSEKQTYQIRVKGHVNLDWSAWFEEIAIEHEDTGETVLRGLIPDQTALHGILMRIRDLGLTLLEVRRIEDVTES